MKIGVSLGSGSFRGICHLGFIKAIEENNIKPSVICGSSIGSIIGALWSGGLDSKEIIKIFKKIKSLDFLRYISLAISRKGFINTKVDEFLKKHIGEMTFDQLKVKFIAITTEIKKAQRIPIKEGSVIEAVKKSIAIPGIIKPYVDKDDIFVDGGVLAPLPIKELRDENCKKIICSSLIPKKHTYLLETPIEKLSKISRNKIKELLNIDIPEPSPSFLGIYKRVIFAMNMYIENLEIEKYSPTLVVKYDIEKMNISALDEIDKYIDLSYRETMERLEELSKRKILHFPQSP